MRRDLIERAIDGDREAFQTLAADALERMHRTARLILRDEQRAADAVQEALVTAWLHIRALRDPDRFDAWLGRLLVRVCYRLARQERRHRVAEVPLIEDGSRSGDDLESEVVSRDRLARAFARLSPEHRAVLVVRHWLELPEGEAAAVLGIAVGTYKSRLSRALVVLRASLEADERPGMLVGEAAR